MDKPISLDEKVSAKNRTEIKKRINKGVVWGLRKKTLDNAAAKKVLNGIDSLLKEGETIFSVLMKVDGILNRSFRETGFDGGHEPVKIFQRQFTSPNIF